MTRVRTRHVFYVSGFDPNGPAHYHRLYREQAALQAAVSGYALKVGRRRTVGPDAAQWSLDFEAMAVPADAAGPATVRTCYEFLRWDDIVRAHWPRGLAAVAAATLGTTWHYLRAGAVRHMLPISWPPCVALFLPALLLLGLAVALPLLSGLALLAVRLVPGSGLAGAVAALAIATLLLTLAWQAEKRLHMQWLMRSFAFTRAQAAGRVPELDARLDAFAARLRELATRGEVDEILLVGHSSGTIMALSALARALRADPGLGAHGPALSLLTLGHCTPMLSSLPEAAAFRADLAEVAASRDVHWVDISAPPDGCCCALTDPVRAAGLAPAARAGHPKLLSPRFAALFTPAPYAAIRHDRFRLHFQYVMASELPGVYDYFAITAGPETLAGRFAAHASVEDFDQFRLFGKIAPAR
ncbi:MAG: hypothetical protein ABI699_10845 [Caldimonas sp.]